MAIYARAFHHIGSELDLMQEYVLTIRGALKTVHHKFRNDVKNKIANMGEERAQEYVNDSAEDDIFLGDLFPALSSSWTLVSIISFLEHELVYICREVGKAKSVDGVFEFRPRSAVLDACKECIKGLGITIPVDKAEWGELKRIQEVRNTIVHRLGEVEDDVQGGRDEDLYRYTRLRTDIAIEYQKIVPTHDFCLHTIELVRSFLDQVVALIPRFFVEFSG